MSSPIRLLSRGRQSACRPYILLLPSIFLSNRRSRFTICVVHVMSVEEAFTVSWEQKPQRQIWINSSVSTQFSPSHIASQRRYHIKSQQPLDLPQPGGWEYLDHTADVQIHSWGSDLANAYGAAVVGMSSYMVELCEISSDSNVNVHVQGHDQQSLLFNLMDECLYIFHTEQFVTKRVKVESLDTFTWEMNITLYGGTFDPSQHSQGTEVKAITYSNMQILSKPTRVDTFVIVDI